VAATVTFAEFQKLIERGHVPAVLVVHGEEPFLARLAVDLLKRRVLTPGSEAFDFASLSGGETSAEAIAAQAATAPMLSERRLTVVYEFERMNPSQKQKLLEHIGPPGGAACLVLVSFGRLRIEQVREGASRPSRGARLCEARGRASPVARSQNG